jgi:3-oxoacyl-[acyl-carrier-protein] synthase-3
VVSGNETLTDLAIHSAQEALASAGLEGKDIDLIIVACSTPDEVYPAVCCQVQEAIGAVDAAGFDISMACSGFIYGLITAQQFIKTGVSKRVLVIAADVHSRRVDWTDRNTCVLFGDGSGAAILEATVGQENILATEMRLNGSHSRDIVMDAEFKNCPLVESHSPARQPYVAMNGREVFKFAVTAIPQAIQRTISKANMHIDDLDYLVLHQANLRIIDAMSEKLNFPRERMPSNLEKYGNTSAASIPLVLNEMALDGRLQPGHLLALSGYGAGLAWATMVFRWTAVDHRLSAQTSTSCNKTTHTSAPSAVNA